MIRITLNLLPPSRKAALRTDFIFASAQSVLVAMCLLALFAAGTLMGVRLLVKNVLQDIAARSSSSTVEHVALTAEVRAINGYLTRVEALQGDVPWSGVLRSISELAPAGVHLSSIRTDADGSVDVSGLAASRDDMLAMRDRLEASPLFTDVASPLSNILQQNDVNFEFEFRYALIEPAPANKSAKPGK